MKKGKIGNVLAIEVMCVECEEACVDENGSFMIIETTKTVTCERCSEVYSVPSSAFVPKKLRTKKKAA